jgi:hypothetical protein
MRHVVRLASAKFAKCPLRFCDQRRHYSPDQASSQLLSSALFNLASAAAAAATTAAVGTPAAAAAATTTAAALTLPLFADLALRWRFKQKADQFEQPNRSKRSQ